MLVGSTWPIRRSSRSSPPTGSTGPGAYGSGAEPASAAATACARRGAERVVARVLARDRDERGGRLLAQAEARALEPDRRAVRRGLPGRADRALELLDELGAAAAHARDVGADVGDPGRARLQREQGVEARDAVRLGGRDGQPAADVAERGRADPADRGLQLVQDGQEQVALRPGRVAATRGVAVGPAGGALPGRGRAGRARASTASRSAAEGSLAVRRRSTQEQASGPAPPQRTTSCGAPAGSFSTRIALALNSAVPDLGSVASIVRTFVSTSSGKCRVMNASPGRSVSSTRTGATTEPRRDVTRTRSPGDHAEALAVLGGEVERLAPAQRRGVAAALDAGVVRVEPAARGQADRELVGQLVDRQLVHDDVEGRQRAGDRLVPQPAVQELLAGMLLVPAGPLQADLVQPPVAHARVHRRERPQLVPHLLGGRAGPSRGRAARPARRRSRCRRAPGPAGRARAGRAGRAARCS